jgi:hypothetical protein
MQKALCIVTTATSPLTAGQAVDTWSLQRLERIDFLYSADHAVSHLVQLAEQLQLVALRRAA